MEKLNSARGTWKGLETGNDGGMANRCVLVFSQVPAHPSNTFSAHDVVGGYMSAHHDHRTRR